MVFSCAVETSRRDDLLEAAYLAIAEHGVRGLRVEDVAARAGVAVSLVYYHFASRAGLLEATLAFTEGRSSFVGRLEGTDAWTYTPPAYEGLRRAILGELEGSESWRVNCIVWNELTASAIFDADLQERVHRVNATWVENASTLIGLGRLDGSIRADVDERLEAELITCLVDGVVLRWLSGGMSRERGLELLGAALEDRLTPSDGTAAVVSSTGNVPEHWEPL